MPTNPNHTDETLPSLKACPFCGATLQEDGDCWHHEMADCPLSDSVFDENQIAEWNNRATPNPTPEIDPPISEIERVARAIADRRGSKVVQHFHRADAHAAIAAIRTPEPIKGDAEAIVEKLERRSIGNGLILANPDGTEAAAFIRSQSQVIERLEGQLDEETTWDKAVDAAGGLDQFDALADQWVAREPIKRMVRATTSVFAKWANDELMTRYHAAVENIVHQAFVEGAAVGARAALTRSDMKGEGE